MDVLYDNMSLPDLMERTGIEAVKQVMDERIGEIWEKWRNCFLPDYKTWQRIILKQKNLAIMNKVSEEPRAFGADCLWPYKSKLEL